MIESDRSLDNEALRILGIYFLLIGVFRYLVRSTSIGFLMIINVEIWMLGKNNFAEISCNSCTL